MKELRKDVLRLAGNLHNYGFERADNVHALSGVCPSVMAHLGDQMGHCIWILEEDDEDEEG